MKSLIIHAIAYSLTYLLLAIVFLGLVGIVNRLFHKPFLDQWKDRLFWFTFTLLVGSLFDLVTGNLKVILAVPCGLALLSVATWLFVKRPSVPSKREQSDTSAEQGAA